MDPLYKYNNFLPEKASNKAGPIFSGNPLKNITIYNLDNKHMLTEKIHSKTADISDQNWVLKEVIIHTFKNGITSHKTYEEYSIFSQYDHDKIKNLLKFTPDLQYSIISLISNSETK